jgi:hypothetical protein
MNNYVLEGGMKTAKATAKSMVELAKIIKAGKGRD